MTAVFLLWLLVAVVAGWRAWRRLRHFLHVFQLEGYKLGEFGAWLRRRLVPLVVAPSHLIGALLVGVALATAAAWAAWAALTAWLIVFASDGAYSAREKKPLAFTQRMKRLVAVSAVLGLLAAAVGLTAGLRHGPVLGAPIFLVGFLVADLGAPLWVALASLILKPLETHFQQRFKFSARRKLERATDLTVVGITGSYGKTSVKFATAEILRQRFNTLATPGSYNTPMGLCLVINNQLRPDHRMLVLEYGIRYPGDMDELVEIARPHIAVVSSIGVAHLESMGSIERIAHEKGKLVEAVRPGGTVVLNADDERVAAMAQRIRDGVTVLRVSTGALADADLVASDITYGRHGAHFEVSDRSGIGAAFRTRLLGEHNVMNILLGLGVGRAMGLGLRQLVPAVERIRPVEHRLEIKQDGGITIIDDAFNANPVGARNAVDILAEFNGGRRVIVTPGMIELGQLQEVENRKLGEHIARRLTREGDLAVLVGPQQTAPIQEGLSEAGYPRERLRVVKSLYEAREFLRSILREGDVVLYENDLPDQYEEG